MAKKAVALQRAPDVEVLPAAEAEEVGLIEAATTGIMEFVRGLRAWMTTAVELQKAADSELVAAKALVLPKTADEDEALQRVCKRIATKKRGAEDHYEDIGGLFFHTHKRIVSRRKKTTDRLDEAHKLGNDLHNTYVENARRAAALEQDRVRQVAEQKARDDRQAELDELERKAVASEEASGDLSDREQVFVEKYMAGLDGTRAAKAAGYAEPLKAGARLIGSAKIVKAIEGLKTAASIREQAASVAELPVEVEVREVKADITYSGGSHDRTTWTAELLDEQALISAAIAGKVPTDILTIDTTRLNEHARSLKEKLNTWPGVRAKKSTRLV